MAVLALAGQLSGYWVRVNRGIDQEFAETFERIIVTQQIYEIGGYRVSCTGGQTMLDFMLTIIGRQHGAELSNGLANHCVKLMEANIEGPLMTDETTVLVGISRRQLEWLCHQYLAAILSKYDLEQRPAKAKIPWQRTSKSVWQISTGVQILFGCSFYQRVSREVRRDVA